MAVVSNPETIREMMVDDGQKAKQQRVYAIWSWQDAAGGEIRYEVCYSALESERFEANPPAQAMNNLLLWENGILRPAGKQFLGVPEDLPPSGYQLRLEAILGQLADPARDPALEQLLKRGYDLETISQLHEQIKQSLDQVLDYLKKRSPK